MPVRARWSTTATEPGTTRQRPNDDTSVSFSYTITDGTDTVAGTATLDITPVNDAPTTSPVTLTAIAEDSGARTITQAELLANAGDVEGDSLTATGLAISAGTGTLVDNGDGTWDYTPAANDDTSVSFSYTHHRRHGQRRRHRHARYHAGQRRADHHSGHADRDRRGQRRADDHPGRTVGQRRRRRRRLASPPPVWRSAPAPARWSTTATGPGTTHRRPTTTPRSASATRSPTAPTMSPALRPSTSRRSTTHRPLVRLR